MSSNDPNGRNDTTRSHDEQEYVCDVCGRTFESEAELERHVHEEGQLE